MEQKAKVDDDLARLSASGRLSLGSSNFWADAAWASAAATAANSQRLTSSNRHLIASVDIMGGRTGLFSRIRSSSAITAIESFGTT